MNEQVMNLFMERLAASTAGAYRAGDTAELQAIVDELTATDSTVYCPAQTSIESTITIPESRRCPDYAVAGICVEQAQAAIAETGTVVCTSSGGKAVQAGLLPIHHIAIVRGEDIFPDLASFFERFADEPPTNVTLITGPSRTADIELTITVGVHGPARLDVIVAD